MLLCSILLLLFSTGSYRLPEFKSKHFNVELISDGVWAVINNDNYGHAICNAGIIDLGDKTVIVDPLMNIDAAEDLKKVAIQLTHKQATIVINTHYHNDHIRGNQVFLPATIISSEWTKNEMAISEPEELAWEKANASKSLAKSKEQLKTATGKNKEELPMWIGYYEGMIATGKIIKTTLPNLTFKDSLWIYGNKRNIQLVECKNGHSPSDVIVIAGNIVFMGDLLFIERHPYLADGDADSWKNHLQNLLGNNQLEKFLPGHGPMGDKKGVQLELNYINDLQQLVKTAIDNHQPDSIIKKTPVPAAYINWKFDRFYPANLEFLIQGMKH